MTDRAIRDYLAHEYGRDKKFVKVVRSWTGDNTTFANKTDVLFSNTPTFLEYLHYGVTILVPGGSLSSYGLLISETNYGLSQVETKSMETAGSYTHVYENGICNTLEFQSVPVSTGTHSYWVQAYMWVMQNI